MSLLAALGCGDWLLGVILEELSRDPRYEFCVVASTPGAATFYERHGFVRVGAIARYLDPEVDDVESTAAPAKPWQAYRHWAWGDERRESLRDNHGEPSYMMARRVRPRTGDGLRRAANAVLRQRDERMSRPRPRVQPSQNPAPAPSYSSPDYFVPPPTSYQAPRSPSPSPPPPPARKPAAKPAARRILLALMSKVPQNRRPRARPSPLPISRRRSPRRSPQPTSPRRCSIGESSRETAAKPRVARTPAAKPTRCAMKKKPRAKK